MIKFKTESGLEQEMTLDVSESNKLLLMVDENIHHMLPYKDVADLFVQLAMFRSVNQNLDINGTEVDIVLNKTKYRMTLAELDNLMNHMGDFLKEMSPDNGSDVFKIENGTVNVNLPYVKETDDEDILLVELQKLGYTKYWIHEPHYNNDGSLAHGRYMTIHYPKDMTMHYEQVARARALVSEYYDVPVKTRNYSNKVYADSFKETIFEFEGSI